MYCRFGIEFYVLFSTQVEVFVCKMGRVDRLGTPTLARVESTVWGME